MPSTTAVVHSSLHSYRRCLVLTPPLCTLHGVNKVIFLCFSSFFFVNLVGFICDGNQMFKSNKPKDSYYETLTKKNLETLTILLLFCVLFFNQFWSCFNIIQDWKLTPSIIICPQVWNPYTHGFLQGMVFAFLCNLYLVKKKKKVVRLTGDCSFVWYFFLQKGQGNLNDK